MGSPQWLTPAPTSAFVASPRSFPVTKANLTSTRSGPIDLDIARGEFVSVVGPSGCGKSTLLDILSGLSAATSGTAVFDGKALVGAVPDGIGAVFQQDASFFWLNVWDNVAFGLRRRGADAAEVERRVRQVLSFMGLADFAKAYPAQLSGGMRQRVCIARTLVLEPTGAPARRAVRCARSADAAPDGRRAASHLARDRSDRCCSSRMRSTKRRCCPTGSP